MWSSISADKLFSETSQIPWENLTAHDYLQHSQAGWLFLFYLVQSPVTQDIVTVAWIINSILTNYFLKSLLGMTLIIKKLSLTKAGNLHVRQDSSRYVHPHFQPSLYHPCLSRVSAYIFALQTFCDFLVYCNCCWM